MNNATLFTIAKLLNEVSSLVIAEIKAREVSWMHLAEYGLTSMAVIAYRREHQDASIRDALDAVRKFQEQ